MHMSTTSMLSLLVSLLYGHYILMIFFNSLVLEVRPGHFRGPSRVSYTFSAVNPVKRVFDDQHGNGRLRHLKKELSPRYYG